MGAANGTGVTNIVLDATGAFKVGNSAATLNLGANSVVSGAFSLSKTGSGTLTLAGANTFGGSGNSFTLSAGTLNINNASALGNAANTFIISGGTIDNTSGAAITTSNYAQTWAADFAFSGSNALNLGTGPVTLTANRTVTVNGSAPLTVGGVISGGGFGLTKAGPGTLTLTGASTYTGATTVFGGTLNLDFSAAGAPASNIINASSNSSPLVMSGGVLRVIGSSSAANSQQFNGMQVSSGASSAIQLVSGASPQNLSLSLGSISRNLGGTIDFTLPSGAASASNGITTTSGTANTLLANGAAYATVGGNDWAAKDASNTNVVGLSSIPGGYVPATATSLSGNADIGVGLNPSLTSNATISSLRLNQPQATTVSLGGNTLTTGGILVTPAVGNNASLITGGTLQGPAYQDLVVIQNNTAAGLTIASSITNNGTSPTALTKAGPGTLTLTGNSTYSLGTFVSGGQLNISSATAIGTGSLVMCGGNLDNTSGSALTLTTNNPQNWNRDFTFVGTNDLNFGTGVVSVNSNLSVTVAGGTLSTGGNLSGQNSVLTKSGNGVLALSGNATIGTLNVNGGIVDVSGSNQSTGVLGTLSAINVNNGGILRVSADSALTGTTGATPITVNAGGTLTEANNASVHIAGVLTLAGGTLSSAPAPTGNAASLGTFLLDKGLAAGGTSATSTISAVNVALTQSGGTVFTVSPGAANGIDLDVTGSFAHTAGSLDTGLIKVGTGVMRLNGTNTYTGQTKVSAGTLALAGNASIASPSILVSSGAILDVSALSAGSFSIGSNQVLTAGRPSGVGTDIIGTVATALGTLDIAGTGTAGTLTINGGLVLNGGSVNLDLEPVMNFGGKRLL